MLVDLDRAENMFAGGANVDGVVQQSACAIVETEDPAEGIKCQSSDRQGLKKLRQFKARELAGRVICRLAASS